MSTTLLPPLSRIPRTQARITSGNRYRSLFRPFSFLSIAAFVFAAFLCTVIAGCGSGGYPGGGITSLSASSLTLDAGQSVAIKATLANNLTVSWSLSGSSCSGSAGCGTLSSTTGGSVTYTAPSVASQIQTTLTAAIAGTKNSQTVAITVNPDPTISGSLAAGVVGTPYSGTLKAAGGTAPLTLSVSSGSLPPGLSFNAATGAITGTPTTAGTYTFTAKVVDSSSVPDTVTAAETITVTTGGPSSGLTLTTTTLPNGTVGVPYLGTIGVSGGTGPYSCAITSGTLPAGLSLSGCIVSGTPTTPGTSTVTVKVTDSSNPALTTTGPETITIAPAPLTLTTATLPNGTVGVPYSATIGVSGGTSPYSCTITSGTLPAGLSLGSGCAVTGTPTTAGTATVTVKVTDSSNPTLTTSGPETITIAPAPLSLTTTKLPNGTVGVPYSATIGVSGGTSPYSCTITSGTLPAGLSLGSGCAVSGTPTAAGTSTVTVKVTDSSNPAQTTSGPETITIAPAPLTLTLSTLPNGTVGVPYSATIGVSGGTAPYNCTITTGTLPGGLTLGANCLVSGTPTTAGTSTVTVKVTDSSNPQETTTGQESITIDAAGASLVISTLPNGTVGVAYTGTVTTTGGTSPYTCVITGLPAGLTANNCSVTGTPTTAGTSTVTIKVTDSSNPTETKTVTQTITIAGAGSLTLTLNGTLPNAIVNTAYTSGTSIVAAGGTSPYTYAITAGALPPGLNLTTSGGQPVITGTPTTVGASSFTITATDSTTPTAETASLNLVLLVTYKPGGNESELDGPYAYLFQGYDDAVLGVLDYKTATVGSFTADGTGVIDAGELDSNHQSSSPSGTTVATQTFLGTYQVNTDNRGFITITLLNADGTTGSSITYAISLQAASGTPAISHQGDLIEYDNNNLAGTRGSGSLYAQTPSAVTAGLNGSYAFGLSGDTPCLLSCAVNINLFGPAATVGQFATGTNSTITGMADANIADQNYPSATLDGSYQPSDQNGRVQLSLTNYAGPGGAYPTDFAAYIVSANEVLLMSTDKHSAYTLLSGTASLQTTPDAFSSASLNSAVVGYENTLPNPGLVSGTTLDGLLSLSSATIFRADCSVAANTCDTTDVDNAGLTNFLNGVSSGVLGILGVTKLQLVQALLGAYSTTGNSSFTAISSIGRGELDYPTPSGGILTGLLNLLGLEDILPDGVPLPRVFYLSAPNQGYFLETGYAGLGQFEPQTGSPFSLGTLTGTYVIGTTPAASLASIDTTGYFTADGNGNITGSALYENVGVGTINILQIGTIGSTTYKLDDGPTPGAATTGRYLLGDGSTVLYAISPDKFVLVNPGLAGDLETAPSVSILYK